MFGDMDSMMLRKAENDKVCIMCSPGSVERKVRSTGKKILLLSQSNVGIKCGICNKFCCIKCLEKIIKVFPCDMKRKNHWFMFVTAFIGEQYNAGPMQTGYPYRPFVGHCCELRFFQRCGHNRSLQKTRFDGCLFLPEYKLIISPCFSNDGLVDIHGFGGSPPNFDGVIHCVPSHGACVEYERKGLKATGISSIYQILDNCPFTEQLQLPYETQSRKVTI